MDGTNETRLKSCVDDILSSPTLTNSPGYT